MRGASGGGGVSVCTSPIELSYISLGIELKVGRPVGTIRGYLMINQ